MSFTQKRQNNIYTYHHNFSRTRKISGKAKEMLCFFLAFTVQCSMESSTFFLQSLQVKDPREPSQTHKLIMSRLRSLFQICARPARTSPSPVGVKQYSWKIRNLAMIRSILSFLDTLKRNEWKKPLGNLRKRTLSVFIKNFALLTSLQGSTGIWSIGRLLSYKAT